MCRTLALCPALAFLAGCGLLLDTAPRTDATTGPDGGRDSGALDATMDAISDASDADAPRPPDTAPTDSGDDSVRPPDAEPACPATPCDPLEQCGCPADLHCTLSDEVEVVCETPGPVAEGDRCASYLDCGYALTCVYVGRPDGVCARFCADDGDCDGGGSRCLTFSVGGGPIAPVRGCSADCDPVTSARCDGLACHAIQLMSGEWATVCGETGARGPGESCAASNQCVRGASCVAGACRTLCSSTLDCGTGYACLRTPALVIGGVSYGMCGAS